VKENFGIAAWLMTSKAMVLKDPNDLFIEADPGGNRFVRAGPLSSEQDEDYGEQ